ncbi:MAG: ABC transporter permease [Asgard group archaeon]|nr:ABC transporter permease [Asgard group archaeon]
MSENKTIKERFHFLISIIINFLLRVFRASWSSLRRIFTQVGGIFLDYYRSPSTIIWTLILPIIFVLLFGAIFGESVNTVYTLPVLDADQSQESIDFCSLIANSTTLDINRITDSTIEPENWMNRHNKVVFLKIPENWGNNVSSQINASLVLYVDPSSATAQTVQEIIKEVIAEYNFRILNIESNFGLLRENFFIKDLSYIDTLVPGIILVTISTSILITGLSYDIQEKNSGILKKFATTPIFRFEWITAKQLWHLMFSVLIGVLATLFALIFNFSISSYHPLMIVIVIFASFTFTGISMILVKLISNPDGVMLASVIITVPQIFLSGAIIPLDTLPIFLQVIARLFPMFYLSEAVHFLMLDYLPNQFWLYFSINAVLAIGLFIIGIFTTNWRED